MKENQKLPSYADRIEAAMGHQFREAAKMVHHEEVAVAEMETTTPTREKSSVVGNAAKMREALLRCDAIAQQPEIREYVIVKDMRNLIKKALSAPPRNCDKQLPADRVSSDDVEQAWRVFRRCDPNVYFDVPGMLRFIAWLFAEVKGENDGSR